ncbi:glycosyltransferase [Paraliobacillus ryukyuensis]|uniref:glycosyltransferase n=1 Tax=Paraliobacillus ryukyuensis TaxID=200904 RepID=UPI0014753EB8|nr:glycosyltransferase [Paraliobacillus ryukyuensis]
MDTILILVSCWLLFQLGFVCWNLFVFPRLSQQQVPNTQTPIRLSVLIPARDEEANIEACLSSVIQQTQQPYEIIVLNDHSTDNTKKLIRGLANKHQSIRLVEGKSLPKGWTGKSYACQQLADHASGDWFLFVDADARLEPKAIEQMNPILAKQGAGIVSGFPRQIVGSWLEKLVVPMMMFVILCHLPIYFVKNSKRAMFAAAHGAFITVHQTSYHVIGGHAAIRDSLLDDMSLMKRMKQYGFPATLAKIDRYVYMRMYHTWKDVWFGFQKNIYTGVNRQAIALLLVIAYYLMLYIVPIVLLFTGANPILVVISYAIAVLTKAIVDYSNGVTLVYSFFLPISVLFVILISFDSFLKSFKKQGYQWKGRSYS